MPKSIVVTFCISLILVFLPLSLATAQEKPQVHLSSDVFIEKITEGVWRHVSVKDLPNLGPVPSNGLIAQFGTEILLIDSAWNDAQTKLILDWIEKELNAKPSITVITHSHEDRLGGIHEIHTRGIRTVSSELTAELAKQQGLESPQRTFDGRVDLSLGGRTIQVWHPGPGHTKDNVVVWLPDQKILVGGCLIKSVQAGDLGNIKEADLPQWPKTMEKVYQEFNHARIVVPGHGDPSGIEAVTHTLELLKKTAGT
jgi:metallo-beta-lactamase class B